MKTMKDDFQNFAPYYDILYGPEVYHNQPGELAFYLKEAKKAKGPVLEIGCGTGRIYLPLMNAGIPIDGIDISKQMLDILKMKAGFYKGKPKVKLGDMTKLICKEKYSLILIPLNSIHHVIDKTEQHKTFIKFHNALKENGKLIFTTQFYAPEILKLKKFTYVETYEKKDWDIQIDLYLKFEKKRNVLRERFVVHDAAIGKPQKFDLTELYCFQKKEIENLLKDSGFTDVKVFKDYRGTPFIKRNELALWMAIKR